MASIAGIDLGLGDARFSAGAAFHLSAPAFTDGQYTAMDGAVATLHSGKSYVVLQFPRARAGKDLLPIAYDAAQKAMDVFSVQGVDDLAIPGGHEGDILWWRQQDHVTLQLYAVVERRISVSARGTVVNAAGTPQPQPPAAPVEWREAFRYFRLSQVTDDLYDSYRNLYLALEAVLSTRGVNTTDPGYQQLVKKRGPEAGRLYYLLEVVARTMNLAPFVGPGVTDVVQALVDEQHKAIRTALFHAKVQHGPILPGSPKTRRQVAQALERLSGLVMALCEHDFGVRRLRGGITPYAWGQNIGGMRDGFTIAVTDDPSEPGVDIDAYRDRTIFSELRTEYLGQVDRIGLELAYRGSVATSQMRAQLVNAVVSYRGPTGLFTHGKIDELAMGGVDKLQVVQIFAVHNRGMPKSRFLL